ncbi:helix-turn-helix domain-containing protein [Acidovorax sp. GBBC 3334]|uniref:helix-turn-helix domain-containing protein n=1 Tax=Acidovorax sp. GBBC 3334 TaxID=2940496 RepID=UPI0023026B16|nr:helix-turn-helix domain-containing protein [Acidovorax sp. GBBC 3334]MDA8453224.1 helix-turn-helix domain-containing protein [Acidovorax sp. GBBC 3334]
MTAQPAPTVLPALPDCVLERWEHTEAPGSGAAPTVVLPDGCRDLILHLDAEDRARWTVSPLALQAYAVPASPGGSWLGFRLHPGAQLDDAALLQAARSLWHAAVRAGGSPEDRRATEQAVLAALDDRARRDASVDEALAALRGAGSVAQAARALGTTPRTLERTVRAATGQPPRYWRELARVRRAAQALAEGDPLAAIAADHGYADQSHFGRACLHWLGATPARLRATHGLIAAVQSSGYA